MLGQGVTKNFGQFLLLGAVAGSSCRVQLPGSSGKPASVESCARSCRLCDQVFAGRRCSCAGGLSLPKPGRPACPTREKAQTAPSCRLCATSMCVLCSGEMFCAPRGPCHPFAPWAERPWDCPLEAELAELAQEHVSRHTRISKVKQRMEYKGRVLKAPRHILKAASFRCPLTGAPSKQTFI